MLLDKLSPQEFVLLSTAIGGLLSEDLTAAERNALGNFFIQIGQTLVTIATQTQNLKSKEIKR